MIKVLNAHKFTTDDKLSSEVEEIKKLLNEGIIKEGLWENYYLFDSENESYIESVLDKKYTGKYGFSTLINHIKDSFGGCGTYTRLMVDDYNEISIDIEDIIFTDDDKYLPDSILENIYMADEPYDYFIEYINKITKEMFKEKLNKLMKKVDNCTMF